MKYCINIFLVFYLVLKPLAPLIDYAVRYDYISQKLCVNKSKPQLNCNGKCYLSKEIGKSSQNDCSPFSKTKNQHQKIIDFYIPSKISEIPINKIKFSNFILFNYPTAYSHLFTKFIFKPPII